MHRYAHSFRNPLLDHRGRPVHSRRSAVAGSGLELRGAALGLGYRVPGGRVIRRLGIPHRQGDRLAARPQTLPMLFIGQMLPPGLAARAEALARDWDLTVTSTEETPTSFLAFATRNDDPVVLKILRRRETSGAPPPFSRPSRATAWYGCSITGRGGTVWSGSAREHALADLALDGRDAEATEVLADVVRDMGEVEAVINDIPTVEDWGTRIHDVSRRQ